jgi:hypothetical protein
VSHVAAMTAGFLRPRPHCADAAPRAARARLAPCPRTRPHSPP